jgi:hypothetical protein
MKLGSRRTIGTVCCWALSWHVAEVAQRMGGYSNAKTTGLYDRLDDDISVRSSSRLGFEN